MDEFKTPLLWSLGPAARERAEDVVNLLQAAPPCHVTKIVSSGIVEVNLDVQQSMSNGKAVTFPGNIRAAVAMPEWLRLPIQVGDKGMLVAATAYLGGVTGLGGGVADLTRRANLTSVVFHPVGNTSWSTVDLNSCVVYGPNGVVLMDQNKKTVLTLTPTGIKITLQAGDAVEIDGDLRVTGEVIWHYGTGSPTHASTHEHSDVQTGGGITGAPVPGS